MLKKLDPHIFATVLLIWILSISFGFLYQKHKLLEARGESLIMKVFPMAFSNDVTDPPKVLGVSNYSSVVIADSTQIDITTDRELSSQSFGEYSVQLVAEDDSEYTYRLLLENLDYGENLLKFDIVDTEGNAINHQLSIERAQFSACIDKNRLPISFIDDGNDLHAILDKHHKIGADFIPDGIINVSLYGLPVYGSGYVRKIVFDPLKKMISDIQAERINITISSGWRRYDSQQRAFNNWVSVVGQEQAHRFAALPGHSEHHLGTTIDFLTSENGYAVNEAYENTRLGKWLSKNAHKYGFVMSYPKNKEQITGYAYEPWHYRYVGPETALEIKKMGITLTEYLYNINKIDCNI